MLIELPKNMKTNRLSSTKNKSSKLKKRKEILTQILLMWASKRILLKKNSQKTTNLPNNR